MVFGKEINKNKQQTNEGGAMPEIENQICFSSFFDEEVGFMMDIVSRYLKKDSYYYYKIKPAEEQIFELLNAEALLAQNISIDKKCLEMIKKEMVCEKIEILLAARLAGKSIFDVVNNMRDAYTILGGDREYVEEKDPQKGDIKKLITKAYTDIYSFTCVEAGEIMDVTKDTACRYKNNFEKTVKDVYKTKYYKMIQIIEEDAEKLLENQDRKLYIRDRQKSGRYLVFDLNEPIKVPVQHTVVKKKKIQGEIDRFIKYMDDLNIKKNIETNVRKEMEEKIMNVINNRIIEYELSTKNKNKLKKKK